MIMRTIIDLFSRHEERKPKPADLMAFEEARARLHETTKSVDRETDVLGAVVRNLKGPTPAPRKKRTAQ